MMGRRRFLELAAAPILARVVAPLAPVLGCRPSEGRAGPVPERNAQAGDGGATAAGPRATVGVASDPDVAGSRDRSQAVGTLVDRALGAADGGGSADLLSRLFRPADRIGIKVNMLAGPGLSTSVDVVEGLVGALRAAGVGSRGIVVFDRMASELSEVGYPAGSEATDRGYRVVGTDETGYSRDIHTSGRVGSLLSNAFLGVDALISVGVVKDHDLAGVGVCVKNLFGLIHNPNRYHSDNCDPFLADLLRMEEVRGRLKLCVADGLVAEWHGGPALVRANTWPMGSILASTDPLAIDAVAADLIEAKRREKGLPTLEEAKRPPRWLRTAEGYGLGCADLGSIRRVEV